MNQQLRSRVLTDYGASASEIEELLNYNRNVFDRTQLKFWQFSKKDEHLTIWKSLTTATNIFEALKPILVQLQFPIRAGISQTEVYRAVTLKGQSTADMQPESLQLQYPEKLQLKIHSSLGGSIPVLLPASRADFVSLVRALTKKNEPEPIPDSMGACIVTNYNNWGKINRYRDRWSLNNNSYCEADWQAEFRRLIPQKQLYRDCFIILSDGFYSGVPPEEMNLSPAEWRRLSLAIRLEHECTHYFTDRVLGSMRNNLLDELIADYQGIVKAVGEYRADWFLRFMGLESSDYRTGGRFENYQQRSLSTEAFKILQQLVRAAAKNLEYFDCHYLRSQRRNLVLPALTYFTLEELAEANAPEQIFQTLERIEEFLISSP